jgi:hypothetical protein
MKLVKELNFLKEDNSKLRQENKYLKNDILSFISKMIQDKFNEMDQIKNQISNLINQINFVNQKIFSIDKQEKKIEKKIEQPIKTQLYNMNNNNQAQFRIMPKQMIIPGQRIEKLDSVLKGNSISVLFKNPNGNIIPVNCYQKDLCSEMIQKYKNKDKEFGNDDSLSFLFNGKNLEGNLSLSEYGITNGSPIVVVN